MSEKQMKGITCCGDCGYYDWKKHRCSRHCKDEGNPQSNFYADCPLPDVAPVVHGEWLNFMGDFSTAECNQCGELYEVSPDEKPCEDFFGAFKKFYKFCPNCGAKIDGGEAGK